jgi:hypothetical protein
MWSEKNTGAIFFSNQPFALISVSAGQSVRFPGFGRRVYPYMISFFVRLNIAIKKWDLKVSENESPKDFYVCATLRLVSKLHLQICVHAKIFLAGKSCSSRTARIGIVSFCRVELIPIKVFIVLVYVLYSYCLVCTEMARLFAFLVEFGVDVVHVEFMSMLAWTSHF